MKNQIFTLMLCALAAQGADAKVRTTRQMVGEAARVLATKGNTMKAKATGELKVLKRESQLSIVGYEGGRCVVIANDDTFQPVLAYYDAPKYGEQNPALEWWMETMNQSLADKLSNGELPDEFVLKDGYKTEVAPLLTTTWGQSSPFNDLCPFYTTNGNKNRYITGCVATAMAQVLKYHQYPEKGSGEKCEWTYMPDGVTERTGSVRFITKYDWANMIDKYTDNATSTQKTAVAKLMRDCGAASAMQYAPDGSGTTYTAALKGMRKYLTFDYASKCYFREFTPKSIWMDMVYYDLSEGRPVMYSGSTKKREGHAFVFDGYDKDGLVHVEWGWEGIGDGYFDMSLLNSEQGSYTEGQTLLLTRKPGTTDFNKYESHWGLGQSLKITLSGTTIKVGKVSFYNLDVDNFTGQIQLLCFNLQTNKGYVLTNIGEVSSMPLLNGGSIELGDMDLKNLGDGVYQIFFGSHSTSDDTPEDGWMPMYGGDGIVSNYILTVKNGEFSLKKGNDDFSVSTGINKLTTSSATAKKMRVYSIDGRVMGNDINAMGKGLYIVDGKKVMK